MIVSATELKRHFSKYLNLVISGKTITITRYNKIIAVIEPINR